ncbi:MAG: hypothetical protein ABW360_12345 [Phenylobacterium sp.]
MNATLQAAPGGPMSMACVIHFDSTTDGAVIHMLTSAQASRPWIEMFGNWNYGTTAGARSGPAGVTGAWYLAIFSKQTGNVAPEYTIIPLATGGTGTSGTLTGGGATLGDGTAAGAGGIIQVARWGTSATEYIDGRIAAAAIWNVYMNQATRESLTTWALWLASSGIQWAVRFNTLSTLTDATGLGGGETGRFGTATQTMAADPGALAIDFFGVGGALTDGSGGASAGSMPETVSQGVVLTDASGGGSTGSSPDAVAQGVVVGDGSGGASGGSSPSLPPVVGVTVPDTPGGASAGSSGSTVVQGVVLADTSGGGSAAGSTDGVSAAGSLTDGSGGAGAGSSPSTVAAGVLVQDASGGASAGGTPEAPGAATFVADGSGGAGGGSSPGGLTVGVNLADTSGGAGAGPSPSTVAAGVLVPDGSGGSSAGSSAGLVATSGAVTIVDSSGGAGAGSSPGTVTVPTPTVVRDTMVMPVLLSALACLQNEAAKVEKPPALFTIRPGDSFEPSADPWTDECCVGIGWVRMVSSFETYDFPAPASVMEGNCPPHSWAVVIEVGINRCVPVAGDGRGSVVTSEQWLAAAQAQADDGAALRRMLCCLRELYDVADVTAGQVNPLPLQATCGGVVLTVTVRRDACDCYDPTSH